MGALMLQWPVQCRVALLGYALVPLANPVYTLRIENPTQTLVTGIPDFG
jgi:hypothetical protein